MRHLQISLGSIFCVITLIAIWIGLLVSGLTNIAAVVLAANFFGILLAWFITHVLGLPNDGSQPCVDDPVFVEDESPFKS
ncbi:MAG: hypothetical protein AAF497_01055 [Planctomycetota bacterium]